MLIAGFIRRIFLPKYFPLKKREKEQKTIEKSRTYWHNTLLRIFIGKYLKFRFHIFLKDTINLEINKVPELEGYILL